MKVLVIVIPVSFKTTGIKLMENLKVRGGIQHNINASLSPKIGFFSISPNFRYNESWYNKSIKRYTAFNDTGGYYIQTDDVKDINLVRSFFKWGFPHQQSFMECLISIL